MVLFVYEVLEKVSKARKKEQKIKILKDNESWALKDVLINRDILSSSPL